MSIDLKGFLVIVFARYVDILQYLCERHSFSYCSERTNWR